MKKLLYALALTILLTACADTQDQTTADATSDAPAVEIATTEPEPPDEGPVVIVETEPEITEEPPNEIDTAEEQETVEIVSTEPETVTESETNEATQTATTTTEPEITTVAIKTEIGVTINDEPEIIGTPEIQIETDETGDVTVEIIDPPPPPFRPKFVIKTGTDPSADYYLSDGITTKPWLSGQVRRAGSRLWTHGAELIQYDASADPSPPVTLLTVPTQALAVGADIYYCREFTAAESFELGAQARIHTEIYKNDAMISFFALNQWGCSDIVNVGANVWIIDTNGGFHAVESSPGNISQVIPNRFFIHSQDTINKTVIISDGSADTLSTYETNWTFSGSQWIRSADGIEYSESGTIWSPDTGLIEFSTALSDFNAWPYPITPEPIYGEAPVFLAVGERSGLLYWIETNSGWLFVYDPLSDGLTQSWRLYAGDGTHAAGIGRRDTLSPWLDIETGELYFSEPGSVSVLDIDSGFISIFYGGDGVVSPF